MPRCSSLRSVCAFCGFCLSAMLISEIYDFTLMSAKTSFLMKNQRRFTAAVSTEFTGSQSIPSKLVMVNTNNELLKIEEPSMANTYTEPSRTFVKVHGLEIYLLSAVPVTYTKFVDKNNKTRLQYSGHNGKTNPELETYPAMVLNGWEAKEITANEYKCCFRLTNGSTSFTMSSTKRNWVYLGRARLQAKQYVCPIIVNQFAVELVSLTSIGGRCDFNESSYIRPLTSLSGGNWEIGICAKLAYGTLDPGRLLEWLEVHRYQGVSKVLVYTHKLNNKALEILQHYQTLGFVELIAFDLPKKDSIRREVGSKNMQSWNDEQVVVYDCQERLASYQYVAIIDTDEFLVTENNVHRDAWIKYLDGRLKASSNLATLKFSSKIHITDWEPSTNKSQLFIGQYLNSTVAFQDRAKNVYMTSRVVPGSVSTHFMSSFPGYSMSIENASVASIHHYRSCRKEWRRGKLKLIGRPDLRKNHTADLLEDFHRYPSTAIENVTKAVEQVVTEMKVLFGL